MPDETQISTLVDSQLREDFDVAAAKRRVKLKDAVAQAIRLWIVAESAEIPAKAGGVLTASADISSENSNSGAPTLPKNGYLPQVPPPDTLSGILSQLAEIRAISEEALARVKLIQGQGHGPNRRIETPIADDAMQELEKQRNREAKGAAKKTRKRRDRNTGEAA